MRVVLSACLVVLFAFAARADPSDVPWQWDAAQPDLFPRADLVVTRGSVSYTLALTAAHGHDRLRLGNGRWTITLPADDLDELTGAALAADDTRAYVATYNKISSGCTLRAYAAADGHQLWSAELTGVGPIGHSKYFNRVQLTLIGGNPVVFGNEAAARYIEVRVAATGGLVSNRRLPAEYPVRPIAEPLFDELDHRLASTASCTVDVDDFLARHVLMTGSDRAARAAAFREAARQLDGTRLQHGRYRLEVKLVDTPAELAVKASRR